jgi:UDP-glucose:(heptosyl)LPS alpha-1,3-glucosyltransferase
MVIDEPYEQRNLDNALAAALRDDAQRAIWRSNGLAMAATADIYSLFERAAGMIVAAARHRQP